MKTEANLQIVVIRKTNQTLSVFPHLQPTCHQMVKYRYYVHYLQLDLGLYLNDKTANLRELWEMQQ